MRVDRILILGLASSGQGGHGWPHLSALLRSHDDSDTPALLFGRSLDETQDQWTIAATGSQPNDRLVPVT